MAAAYCNQCGHTNPQDARFCANCGTALAHLGRPGGASDAATVTWTWQVEAGEPDEDVTEDVTAIEALRPGTAMLVTRRGPNAGSRFLLDTDATTAGRHAASDIFLDDITVSRRHAEFRRAEGRFTVADVGSLNGTYVNKERIDSVPLTSGDEVMIGKFRMVFVQAPPDDHTNAA